MEKAEKDRKQKLWFRFIPTRRVTENSKKIEKKFRKFKNTIVASFQAIIGLNRGRDRGNKNYLPFRSNPTRHRKFIKNCKKIKKIKKNTVMASFQGKFGWKRPRKGENTNYRFVSFLPNA